MARLTRAQRRKQALAVLAEVLDGIQHLPRPVMGKLAPILAQAQAELENDLKFWLAKQPTGATFTAQRYRNALIAIRRSMETIKGIEPALMDGLRVGSNLAGNLATAHLEKELVRFGDIFEGTIQPVSLDTAAIIASEETLLIKRFKSSARRYTGDVRRHMIRELAVSRARSETIDELTGRLARNVPTRFTQMRGWGERLARTETMNAYNVMHHQGLEVAHEEDPGVLMRWDASFDFRRCPLCASLDGATVAVDKRFTARWTQKLSGGRSRGRRMTLQRPPAHPNCRCVLVPWRRDWEELDRPTTPAKPGKPSGATVRKMKKEKGLST